MPEGPLVLVDRVARTAPGAALVVMAPGRGRPGAQPGEGGGGGPCPSRLGERHHFLRDRLGRAAATDRDALLRLLVTSPGEPPVTCVPGPGTSLGRRWARLATALLDPAARAARILDGTPAEHAGRPWCALRA
ncbi:hypothetical protein [Streptomyces sp. NPDC004435]|uniref:hypothetical protein n=1 Tax=Streptomyces sp. NPDC004435 TaxID=3364701 RepID=UPI00369D05D2